MSFSLHNAKAWHFTHNVHVSQTSGTCTPLSAMSMGHPCCLELNIYSLSQERTFVLQYKWEEVLPEIIVNKNSNNLNESKTAT